MKRSLICFVLLVSKIVWCQVPPPELSWTFQWGTNTYGLLYGDTNLTSGVKAAIRDDIEQTYRHNPQSNTTFRLYLQGEQKYNEYTGLIWLEKAVACPKEIRTWNFRVYGGTNYLFVSESLCSTYSEKVALTNRQNVAISCLSNFIYSVNHLSASNTTLTAFAQMWWRFKKGRTGALSDDTPQSFMEGIQSMDEDYYYPSLLYFWERTSAHWNVPSAEPPILGCTIKALPKGKADDFDEVDMDAIFKDGAWRFVAWE